MLLMRDALVAFFTITTFIASAAAEGKEERVPMIPAPAPAMAPPSLISARSSTATAPAPAPVLHRALDWTFPTYVEVPTGGGGYVYSDPDGTAQIYPSRSRTPPSPPSYRSPTRRPSYSPPSSSTGSTPSIYASNRSDNSPEGLSGGAIAGIVIAVLVVLVGVVVGAWFYKGATEPNNHGAPAEAAEDARQVTGGGGGKTSPTSERQKRNRKEIASITLFSFAEFFVFLDMVFGATIVSQVNEDGGYGLYFNDDSIYALGVAATVFAVFALIFGCTATPLLYFGGQDYSQSSGVRVKKAFLVTALSLYGVQAVLGIALIAVGATWNGPGLVSVALLMLIVQAMVWVMTLIHVNSIRSANAAPRQVFKPDVAEAPAPPQASASDVSEVAPEAPLPYVHALKPTASRDSDGKEIPSSSSHRSDDNSSNIDEMSGPTLDESLSTVVSTEKEKVIENLPDGSKRIVTSVTTIYNDGTKRIENTIETQNAKVADTPPDRLGKKDKDPVTPPQDGPGDAPKPDVMAKTEGARKKQGEKLRKEPDVEHKKNMVGMSEF